MGIFLQDGNSTLLSWDQGNVNANWTAHSAFFKGTLKAGFDTLLMSSTDARDEILRDVFFLCEHLQNVYLLQFFILFI